MSEQESSLNGLKGLGQGGPEDEQISTDARVVRGIGKTKAEFFAAVRNRGVLNAMLDGPAIAFEEAKPGLKCRWEFAPKTGDNTMVVAREALGFRVVDASEVGPLTDSQQKKGPVQRGDLILMCAPEEIMKMRFTIVWIIFWMI